MDATESDARCVRTGAAAADGGEPGEGGMARYGDVVCWAFGVGGWDEKASISGIYGAGDKPAEWGGEPGV